MGCQPVPRPRDEVKKENPTPVLWCGRRRTQEADQLKNKDESHEDKMPQH